MMWRSVKYEGRGLRRKSITFCDCSMMKQDVHRLATWRCPSEEIEMMRTCRHPMVRDTYF